MLPTQSNIAKPFECFLVLQAQSSIAEPREFAVKLSHVNAAKLSHVKPRQIGAVKPFAAVIWLVFMVLQTRKRGFYNYQHRPNKRCQGVCSGYLATVDRAAI